MEQVLHNVNNAQISVMRSFCKQVYDPIVFSGFNHLVVNNNNVNTALAKQSKEALGGLVPQPGSGRKSTKRKVQFRGLPPFKKRKTVVLDQDQDDFQRWS